MTFVLAVLKKFLNESFKDISLFSYQCSFLSDKSDERRRRDLNPRAAVNDLHPFQGCPFGQLGYFSKLPYIIRIFNFHRYVKRREWDSNPRALSDKRFSRPPRYDHFDISPNCSCLSQNKNYYICKPPSCQQHFSFFLHFLFMLK